MHKCVKLQVVMTTKLKAESVPGNWCNLPISNRSADLLTCNYAYMGFNEEYELLGMVSNFKVKSFRLENRNLFLVISFLGFYLFLRIISAPISKMCYI